MHTTPPNAPTPLTPHTHLTHLTPNSLVHTHRYLLLTVAFIEMCRALLPLFIMLALYLSSLETPSVSMVKAVSLTGFGCMIAAYGEVHLSAAGLLCLLGNFILEAGRLVLMQVRRASTPGAPVPGPLSVF